MSHRHAVNGLENAELNRALAWLEGKKRKLLGAKLALGAYYSRDSEGRWLQDPLTDEELGWAGYSRGVIRERLIPMADARALYQCRQRARKLILQIAAHLDLGRQDQACALECEFQAIRKYIAEVTTPEGRIRSFAATRVKNYQADMQAWYYLLSQAESEDPEVCEFLRRHIRPGDPYLWVDLTSTG
ncbi:MAG: hypothetical protein PHG32_06705 [Candidatus Cloacimonetes bacterium]|nr:hypothetical protein [Candidatus Cloacimonadota bacterium]